MSIVEIIEQARQVEENLGNSLNEIDTQRLKQIREWCEASLSLWDVIVRIGCEISENED